MFHPFFFQPGFQSCHYHNVLADAIVLAAAFKVAEDLQRTWREERDREIQAEVKSLT